MTENARWQRDLIAALPDSERAVDNIRTWRSYARRMYRQHDRRRMAVVHLIANCRWTGKRYTIRRFATDK